MVFSPCHSGPLDVEDIPTADAISQRSGSSEDKSSIDKAPSEKKREGNSDNFVDDVFQFKRGSRRTSSSFLNLFVNQSQQGMFATIVGETIERFTPTNSRILRIIRISKIKNSYQSVNRWLNELNSCFM